MWHPGAPRLDPPPPTPPPQGGRESMLHPCASTQRPRDQIRGGLFRNMLGARDLLGRVLLLPRILDVRDRVELHICELAVLPFDFAHIDVLHDVAGCWVNRNRSALAV